MGEKQVFIVTKFLMEIAYPISSPINGKIKNVDNTKIIINVDSESYTNIVTSPIDGIVSYIEIIKGKFLLSNNYKNVHIEIWISTHNKIFSFWIELCLKDYYKLYIKKGDVIKRGDSILYTTINENTLLGLQFRNLPNIVTFVEKGYVDDKNIIGCYITQNLESKTCF